MKQQSLRGLIACLSLCTVTVYSMDEEVDLSSILPALVSVFEARLAFLNRGIETAPTPEEKDLLIKHRELTQESHANVTEALRHVQKPEAQVTDADRQQTKILMQKIHEDLINGKTSAAVTKANEEFEAWKAQNK